MGVEQGGAPLKLSQCALLCRHRGVRAPCQAGRWCGAPFLGGLQLVCCTFCSASYPLYRPTAPISIPSSLIATLSPIPLRRRLFSLVSSHITANEPVCMIVLLHRVAGRLHTCLSCRFLSFFGDFACALLITSGFCCCHIFCLQCCVSIVMCGHWAMH